MDCLELKHNVEFCSLFKLALHSDCPAHLLNNVFANAEAESGSLGVELVVLIKPSVVFEKSVDILLRYSDSVVFDGYFELYVLHDLLIFR